MTSGLGEVLFERVPVVFVPAGGEVGIFAGGESGVVEVERGSGGVGMKFEFDNGKDAGVPVGGTPGLDDALAGDELDVAADDESAKKTERAAFMRIDGGGESGEGGELLGIEERGFDASGCGGQLNFLMQRGACTGWRSRGKLGHLLCA